MIPTRDSRQPCFVVIHLREEEPKPRSERCLVALAVLLPLHVELLLIVQVLLVPAPQLVRLAAESQVQEPNDAYIRGIRVIDERVDLRCRELETKAFVDQREAGCRTSGGADSPHSATHAVR